MLPGLTHDAARAGERRVTLGAVNTIAGSRPAFVPVRLPSAAEIDVGVATGRAAGPNPSVSVAGRGPFVGVVLTPDPPEGPPALVAGRFAECAGPACPHGRAPMNYMFPARGDVVDGDEVGRTARLPAGDYRLYLIADEGPARVTLRLKGPRGSTRIAPRQPAPAFVYEPEVRKDINTGGAYYGAGKAFDGGSAGFVAQALFFKSESFQGAEYGACLYRAPALPPEPVAYGIQCSGLSGTSTTVAKSATGEHEHFVLTTKFEWGGPSGISSPIGRYGAGVWYAARGAVSEAGSQAFFLSYDDELDTPRRQKPMRSPQGHRMEEWHYEGPAIGASGAGVCTHPIHACALFRTALSERRIEVEIADELGLPVLASVSERVGRGPLSSIGTVCGATEEPLEITPGAELVIFPWAVGRTSCPGAATTGTVTVTFLER